MSEPRSALIVHRMPFGKHRGKPLTELPNSYLVLLQTSIEIKAPWLRTALDEEGNRRIAAGEMNVDEVGVG